MDVTDSDERGNGLEAPVAAPMPAHSLASASDDSALGPEKHS